jgi:hypothetical protein
MKNPDAVTMHVYPPQSMAKATAEQKGDPVEVLSEPFRAMARIKERDMIHFPKNSEIWITEYKHEQQYGSGSGIMDAWTVGGIDVDEIPGRTAGHAYCLSCDDWNAGYGAIFANNQGFSLGRMVSSCPQLIHRKQSHSVSPQQALRWLFMATQ